MTEARRPRYLGGYEILFQSGWAVCRAVLASFARLARSHPSSCGYSETFERILAHKRRHLATEQIAPPTSGRARADGSGT